MTAGKCRASITSVTIGNPVTSRARASSASPSVLRPWKLYGEVRGLNAPPRSTRAPAAFTARAVAEQLPLAFDRARAGDDDDIAAAKDDVANADQRVRRMR